MARILPKPKLRCFSSGLLPELIFKLQQEWSTLLSARIVAAISNRVYSGAIGNRGYEIVKVVSSVLNHAINSKNNQDPQVVPMLWGPKEAKTHRHADSW